MPLLQKTRALALSVLGLLLLLSGCLQTPTLACFPCENDSQCAAPLTCSPRLKRCVAPNGPADQCSGALEGEGGLERGREAVGSELSEPSLVPEEPAVIDAIGEKTPVKDASPEEEGSLQEPASDVPGEATSSELPEERAEPGESASERVGDLDASVDALPPEPEPIVEKKPDLSPCEEDAKLNTACSAGQGACKETGKWVCSADKQRVVCDAKADPTRSKAEDCNGVDDDCDGMVDDGIAAQSCYTGAAGTKGVGRCKAGTRSCINGKWSACNGQVVPQASENCKNCVDDDCNGKVNDGCSWVLSFSSSRIAKGLDVAADGQCNTYVVGDYSGSMTIGGKPLPFVASNSTGVFVSKIAPDQTVQWGQAAKAATNARASSVALDGQGNVYVSGIARGSMTLGSLAPVSGPSAGHLYSFVTKLSPSGTFLWVRPLIASSSAVITRIRMDANNNTYLFGYYSTSLQCGTRSVSFSGNVPQLFVARLNASGTCTWLYSFGDRSYSEGATDFVLDPQGNLYLLGTFKGALSLGGTRLQGNTTSNSLFAAMLVPQTTSANFPWAYQIPSPGNEQGQGIAIDANKQVYILGTYQNSLDFGNNVKLTTNASGTLIYVLKMSTAGKPLWAIDRSSSRTIYGRRIESDGSGAPILSGHFNGSVLFGTQILSGTGTNLQSFVAQAKADGSAFSFARQVKPASSLASSTPAGLFLRPLHIYLTGTHNGSNSFDTRTLSVSAQSAFVWQIPRPGP